MGTGRMGSPAPARCSLGEWEMGPRSRWLPVEIWVLALADCPKSNVQSPMSFECGVRNKMPDMAVFIGKWLDCIVSQHWLVKLFVLCRGCRS